MQAAICDCMKSWWKYYKVFMIINVCLILKIKFVTKGQSKQWCFMDTNKLILVAPFGSSPFSVFLSRCKSQETFAHSLCLRVAIKIQQSRKIPAITDLGFFLAALIKPIHADLLLINFVRRKGRVCIFAAQVSPHFQGFSSEPERRETPAALERT